jgi:cob(I)alamin adenosyltransferase
MKIYTKAGDRGETRLFDGSRVRKDDTRVEAYGSVDELNACIGYAASQLTDTSIVAMLQGIQRDLFSLGSQLADPREAGAAAREKARLHPDRIAALENAIDGFETELPPLRQFILAGGAPAGASLHVARTVCRRAERRVTSLAGQVEIHASVIEYLNRLSDFLFVLARLVNHRQGQEEIPW